VIFLSLSSDVAALRGGYGEERYEKEEMQRRVREVFNLLQGDSRDKEDWRIIDASEGIEQVSDRIWDVVKPIVEKAKSNQLRSIMQ
jgi:dTMP kinase